MPPLKDVAHRSDVKTRLLLFALAALALLSPEPNALGRSAAVAAARSRSATGGFREYPCQEYSRQEYFWARGVAEMFAALDLLCSRRGTWRPKQKEKDGMRGHSQTARHLKKQPRFNRAESRAPTRKHQRGIAMSGILPRALAVIGLALAGAAPPASAEETVRIRGIIEQVEGPVYVVKNRDGAELKLTVTDNPLFVAIVPSTMADIKSGMFVGSAGTMQADGTQKAIEVHIFPESMRGTGEGHYDWDLKPNTKMTNANVEQTVASVDGQILSVKYKDGEKKLLVTPETVVVTYVPGNKEDLKPGTKIFVAAAKKMPDGTVQTPRITYGRNGAGPAF
jgi:hypothetical protein